MTNELQDLHNQISNAELHKRSKKSLVSPTKSSPEKDGQLKYINSEANIAMVS